ncbi:ABC transporter permease subunit [Methanocella arvoryzae]|uniref:ABC-type transport system, permease component n=1 Tax=Methanocella arvoryzae (strain DSM 22066 / NBRC 105507 / MRE50) TaxID=351160 RepID=Q0W2N4_METAR|nr:ABC transporter permease subunit [Methanocella arvoryzae]CAJ37359.1 ABC-type transport system, permease component [Methanocella arvoryzae MRE50]
MTLEVFRQAIKDKYKGAIVASALLFLFVFWMASFYPALKDSMAMYDQLLENPTFKAMLGSEIVSMGTFSGFMAVELFSYIGLVVGAYAAFLAASFLAGEIEQKSSELMLSLPVSRENIVLSRFAVIVPVSILVSAAMLLAVYTGAVFIGEPVDLVWFAYAMLFTGVFMLAVGAGALLLSALMSDGKKAAFSAIGVLLVMFLVENVGSMITSIDWARKLSLYHYAKVTNIVINHDVNWGNLGILLAAAVVFLALAVIAFKRRDINVT